VVMVKLWDLARLRAKVYSKTCQVGGGFKKGPPISYATTVPELAP
jgi:hypothetical protein